VQVYPVDSGRKYRIFLFIFWSFDNKICVKVYFSSKRMVCMCSFGTWWRDSQSSNINISFTGYSSEYNYSHTNRVFLSFLARIEEVVYKVYSGRYIQCHEPTASHGTVVPWTLMLLSLEWPTRVKSVFLWPPSSFVCWLFCKFVKILVVKYWCGVEDHEPTNRIREFFEQERRFTCSNEERGWGAWSPSI